MLSLELLSELKCFIRADNILTDPSEIFAYSYDNSRHRGCADAVVFATTSEQVQKTIQLCGKYQIPLIARGRGTGTTGASVPIVGGIVLSLERMNRILDIDVRNRTITVQPGVLNQTVQDAVSQHGFFWAPDPSSAPYCTVGGNIACNAGGPHAVKYGTTRENILHLTAITGSGEMIQTGTYTTKGSVGYDLTRLLIGSEGTLAIITEAVLKLLPKPTFKHTLRALYPSIHAATEAIIALMSQSLLPSAVEFMDSQALKLVRAQGVELSEAAQALLIVEIEGSIQELAEKSETLMTVLQKESCECLLATSEEEEKKLWSARKALSPALRTLAPSKINEDIVVPIGQLSNLFDQLKILSEKYNLNIVCFGHAGNGNIHVNLLFDASDFKQAERAQCCLEGIFKMVLTLKGTLSGEHGVGLEKKSFLPMEIPEASLALMKQIKTVFDPKGILNPGKLF